MAVIYVPEEYPVIQDAIDAASAGDTILVGPGTYNSDVPTSGSVITINKPLTVRSTDGPAVTTLNGASTNNHYYVVQIEADDVVLDGFTITNPLYNFTADASGITTSTAGRQSNIQILNNIIHDIGILDRTGVSFGTFGLNVGPVDGLEIANNVVYNIGNATPDAYAMGIFVYGNSPTETANHVNIHDNTVYNMVNPNSNFVDGINCGSDSENITITNNSVHASSLKRGIVTNAFMDGPVTITGNDVTGASLYGILLRSPYEQIVTDNTITDNAIGIEVTATVTTTPIIRNNNIYGNATYDLVNDSSVTVDAQYNWWGSPDGPDGKVIGLPPSEYTPFLQAPFSPVVAAMSRVQEVHCTELSRTSGPEGRSDIFVAVTIVLAITLIGEAGLPVLTIEAPVAFQTPVTLYAPEGTIIQCLVFPGTTVSVLLTDSQIINTIHLRLFIGTALRVPLLIPAWASCQPPTCGQVASRSREAAALEPWDAECLYVTKVFDECLLTRTVPLIVPLPIALP